MKLQAIYWSFIDSTNDHQAGNRGQLQPPPCHLSCRLLPSLLHHHHNWGLDHRFHHQQLPQAVVSISSPSLNPHLGELSSVIPDDLGVDKRKQLLLDSLRNSLLPVHGTITDPGLYYFEK